MRQLLRPFTIVERVLRERVGYFGEIARGESLQQKIADLAIITIGGLAIFGFVAGLSGHNFFQAILTTFKLPGVFLASGIICLPTLYYFSVLFGSRLRFMQTVTLILTAQAIAAVLAMGTAPISLLFLISGSEMPFLVVLNISMLALSAALGLIFLIQGVLYVQESNPPDRITFFTWAGMFVKGTLRSVVLAAWSIVYGLVGTQLSYTLRPFFGIPVAGNDFWSSMNSILASLLAMGR
jgi:hypothetical protein